MRVLVAAEPLWLLRTAVIVLVPARATRHADRSERVHWASQEVVLMTRANEQVSALLQEYADLLSITGGESSRSARTKGRTFLRRTAGYSPNEP